MSLINKSTTINKIGLIGLGLMGTGIGFSLCNKGYKLFIKVHKKRKSSAFLKSKGAYICKSYRELATECNSIILCVNDHHAVQDIFFSGNGLYRELNSGHTIIDCTTSSPLFTKKLYKRLKEKGVDYVDAPLTRTPIEAMQGKLNTIVGGDIDLIARLTPLLSSFCENIVHVGDVGMGHKIKLLNNFITIGSMAVALEVINTAISMDIDIKKLREVFSLGAANTPAFQALMRLMLENENYLQFSLNNALKDLGYYKDIRKVNQGSNIIVSSMFDYYQTISKKLGKEKYLSDLINNP